VATPSNNGHVSLPDPGHRNPTTLARKVRVRPVCHPGIVCMCRDFTHTVGGGCSVVTSRSSRPFFFSTASRRRPPKPHARRPWSPKARRSGRASSAKSAGSVAQENRATWMCVTWARHLNYRRPHAACERRRGIQLATEILPGNGVCFFGARRSVVARRSVSRGLVSGRLVCSISERKLTEQGARSVRRTARS
jgi:hypothetical protein